MHRDMLLHLPTGEAPTAMRKGLMERRLEQIPRIGKEESPASKTKVVVRNCVVNKMSRALRSAKLHVCQHRRPSGQTASRYTQRSTTVSLQFSRVRITSTLRVLIDRRERVRYSSVERVVVFGCTVWRPRKQQEDMEACEGKWRAQD